MESVEEIAGGGGVIEISNCLKLSVDRERKAVAL
jgi:hypothetical protein